MKVHNLLCSIQCSMLRSRPQKLKSSSWRLDFFLWHIHILHVRKYTSQYLIPLLLDADTTNCTACWSWWNLPKPHRVTIRRGLVRMLCQSSMTCPGLLVLKTSSKSGLPIAWITGHTTIPHPANETYFYCAINEFNLTFEVQNMGNKAFQNASF